MHEQHVHDEKEKSDHKSSSWSYWASGKSKTHGRRR